MAKFRKVYANFWTDPFVENLTPEDRYFYLFLMTNPEVTECGIYVISKKRMGDLTGYNRETIEKLLERFSGYNKIVYDDKNHEMLLVNKIREIERLGKPMIDCIEAELKRVHNKEFIKFLVEHNQLDGLRSLLNRYI